MILAMMTWMIAITGIGDLQSERESCMSRRQGRRRRRLSRNEKIFYFLSLLIALSMVLSLVYVAITPGA